MKLFLITSTRPSGFVQTDIVYRLDEGQVHKTTKESSETPALLALITDIAGGIECGGVLEVHSKRNTFTNALTEGWIYAWMQDGFITKPNQYKEEWKRFIELIEQRGIDLKVHIESDADLKAVLFIRHADRPGTPVEYPWAKPESPDDMLRRALEKRDRFRKK